jgi:hypothetical protein
MLNPVTHNSHNAQNPALVWVLWVLWVLCTSSLTEADLSMCVEVGDSLWCRIGDLNHDKLSRAHGMLAARQGVAEAAAAVGKEIDDP